MVLPEDGPDGARAEERHSPVDGRVALGIAVPSRRRRRLVAKWPAQVPVVPTRSTVMCAGAAL
jgi:hypothetical protein